jgi:hypothetical protein
MTRKRKKPGGPSHGYGQYIIEPTNAADVLKVGTLLRIFGFWSGFSPNDQAVLNFVYDATLVQGKEAEPLNHRVFMAGLFDAEGDTLVAPLPMSRGTLGKSIRKLRENGILRIKSGEVYNEEIFNHMKVDFYSLNLKKLTEIALTTASDRYRVFHKPKGKNRHERDYLRLVQ